MNDPFKTDPAVKYIVHMLYSLILNSKYVYK